jgi:predicted permease
VRSVVHILRRLRRSPLFTAISLLTLALGIGANTAIFSVIDGVLLKPLPYPHAERLVSIWHTAPGINMKRLNMAPSLYFTYRDENRTFQDVAIWQDGAYSVTGRGDPENVPGLAVTEGFLPTLQVQPTLGRGFTLADVDPKGPRTVMLSFGYWEARFAGDRAVVGRQVVVDGSAREIIGVLPARFEFMDQRFSLLLPLRFNRAEVPLISFSELGIARLKPGVTLAQANADIARMLPMAPEKFALNPGFTRKMFDDTRMAPNLRFLKDDLLGDIGNTLWVLMASVGMVLLIACANVANLLLVRAEGRQQELAVRAALGAGWTRLARDLLLESVLLGVAGGALGLALAYGALRILAASEVAHVPRIRDISIEPSTLLFASLISIAAGLVFGLIPVLKYARPQLSGALRGGGRSMSVSKERHHTRNLLVVVQVALAMVLLVSSGLMIRTFRALRQVDPGFSHAEQVQSLQIAIPENQVKEPERVIRMQQAILSNMEALPGVSSAAIAAWIPMKGGESEPLYAEDHPYADGAIPPIRYFRYISPGYMAALGIRLIAGRELTWNETYRQQPVALVSENLARELWRDPRAALGKRIRENVQDDWSEVVGVVADVRDEGVDHAAPAMVYWPLMAKNFGGSKVVVTRNVSFVIRTPRAGSTALVDELRRAVWSVNPSLPLADVETLQSVYDRSLARTSFTLLLLAIAGGMALLLGVVGIYGVISYSVSQRTREIGIRLALGAPLRDVTRMFLRHGLVLSSIGATVGLVAALPLTRLMKSLLFGVSVVDPLTYVTMAAVLILAAAAASYLPARKATAVDPLDALRAE